MFVLKQSEPGLWTVGHYDGGEWEPVSDHGSKEEAADRAHFLNGGDPPPRHGRGDKMVMHITVREEIASHALQGVLAGKPGVSANQAARMACEAADALLVELRRPKEST